MLPTRTSDTDLLRTQIFGVRIDPTTGLLTTLAHGVYLELPDLSRSSLGVGISGQYVFWGNRGRNDISIFSIDLSTGALTSVRTI